MDMTLRFVWLAVAIFCIQCEKIPERTFIQLRAVSINGTELQEGEGIVLNYEQEAEVLFAFESDSPLDSTFIQLAENFNALITSSDDARVINHPEQGDLEGTFIYTLNTSEQFDPPIGNPVIDTKGLRVIMLNDAGTVAEYAISVLVQ